MATKAKKRPTRRHKKDPVVRAAFARILLELRKKRKLTQEDVAFASGYSTKYISQLERRVNTPTLTAVLQISVALHTDPLVMIGETRKLMPRFMHLARTRPEYANALRE